MKGTFNSLGYISILLIIGLNSYAQPEKNRIHVRSDKDLIYFYPKIPVKDSTCLTNGTLFYVFTTEVAKQGFHLYLENARLLKSENDSLFQLEYLPGMQYEVVYLPVTEAEEPAPPKNKRRELKSLLNGSTALRKDRIRIKIYKDQGEGLVYEKVYCFRD